MGRVGVLAGLLGMSLAAHAQTVSYRSIGADAGVIASGNDASVSAGTTTITFTQALPDVVGLGDLITVGGESLFVNGRPDDTTLTVETAAAATHSAAAWSVQRAYTQLKDWETNQQGNLVSLDRIEVGVVRGELLATETPMTDIEGSVVDATRFMMLVGQPEHLGQSGAGARLIGSGSGDGLRIRQPYVRIEGLEIAGFTTGLDVRSADVFLNRLLIHDSDSAIDAVDRITVRNTVVYDGSTGLSLDDSGVAGGATRVDNCTVFQMISEGVVAVAGAVEVRNTISVGNGTDFTDQTGQLVQENNISTDGTATGPGSQTGVAPSSLFVSTQIPGADLHLLDNAPARDAGQDLSSDFTDDIDLQIRESGAWDIGADEAGVLPTGTPTPPGETPTPTPLVEGDGPYATGGGITCRVSPNPGAVGVPFLLLVIATLGALALRAHRQRAR